MSLDHPYFIFIHLYDNIRDSNGVTERWISIDGEDGTVSGQTDDTNGECAINVQDATSTDGDILTIYDGTFKYECKLDITIPAILLDLYQNASNSNDILIQSTNNGNEIYLTRDIYIGKDVNIKTMSY